MLPGFLYDFCLYIVGGTKFEYLLINRQICVDGMQIFVCKSQKIGYTIYPYLERTDNDLGQKR